MRMVLVNVDYAEENLSTTISILVPALAIRRHTSSWSISNTFIKIVRIIITMNMVHLKHLDDDCDDHQNDEYGQIPQKYKLHIMMIRQWRLCQSRGMFTMITILIITTTSLPLMLIKKSLSLSPALSALENTRILLSFMLCTCSWWLWSSSLSWFFWWWWKW